MLSSQKKLFKTALMGALSVSILMLSACEKTPPDYRDAVTLPVYTQGDADNGALIYEDACGQCHQLTPGLNKKGPQLMNIYGAPAASLADYDYSEALKTSGWVWDAQTLDPYIADAEKALPGSKMLADPMPDASERADVIAYLSTLRADPPILEEVDSTAEQAPALEEGVKANNEANNEASNKEAPTAMTNEAVEVLDGAAHKPAADFQ